jgi:hypothetical protein
MASSSFPSVPGTFEPSPSYSSDDDIPQTLQRAALRLGFPPSYVVVGVYRLCTDPKIRNPAWDKCKHGVMRGAAVGIVWVRRFVPSGVIDHKVCDIGCINFQDTKEIHRSLSYQVEAIIILFTFTGCLRRILAHRE